MRNWLVGVRVRELRARVRGFRFFNVVLRVLCLKRDELMLLQTTKILHQRDSFVFSNTGVPRS